MKTFFTHHKVSKVNTITHFEESEEDVRLWVGKEEETNTITQTLLFIFLKQMMEKKHLKKKKYTYLEESEEDMRLWVGKHLSPHNKVSKVFFKKKFYV